MAALGEQKLAVRSEICRQPSVLRDPAKNPRPRQRNVWSGGGVSIVETDEEASDTSVLRWNEGKVAAWLGEIGFAEYQVLLASLACLGWAPIGRRLYILQSLFTLGPIDVDLQLCGIYIYIRRRRSWGVGQCHSFIAPCTLDLCWP